VRQIETSGERAFETNRGGLGAVSSRALSRWGFHKILIGVLSLLHTLLYRLSMTTQGLKGKLLSQVHRTTIEKQYTVGTTTSMVFTLLSQLCKRIKNSAAKSKICIERPASSNDAQKIRWDNLAVFVAIVPLAMVGEDNQTNISMDHANNFALNLLSCNYQYE
jgi:hypothetical protein